MLPFFYLLLLQCNKYVIIKIIYEDFKMALIRTLNHKDRERIRTHFRNLDSDSLYARFMGTVNQDTLDRYVDRIDFNRDIILGIEDIETFELIGLAEVHPDFDQKNNKYFRINYKI